MKIYNISKGQFITIVVFAVLAWIIFTVSALDKYDSSASDFLLTLLIPAAVIFYGIGWKKAHPKNEKGKVNLVVDEDTKKLQYFYAVPLWKFILLSVTSLGIYELIWAGRNWAAIQQQQPDKKISPAGRGFFLIFFFYPLAKKIYSVAELKGCKVFGNPALVTATFVISALLTRAEWEWSWLFLFGTLIAFIPLVNSIEYLHKKGNYELNERFNAQDWIILMIGPLIFLIPFLYGVFLGFQSSTSMQQDASIPTVYEESIPKTIQETSLSVEQRFDSQISNANLERKCQTEAYNAFQRDSLEGYGWSAHWNTKLDICLLEMTGWDTELEGVWNTWLWDVGGQAHYGTLSIKNSYVAAGLQSKNDNPAKNGTVTTCVLNDDVECSSIEEYYAYRDKLMTE